jgi:glycosyltransferase involved in cell wall biosynthesis
MHISIIIPVLNEEDNIHPLLDSISRSLNGIEYEVIFVDDGSDDNTVKNIKSYGMDNAKVVIFNRNYGQSIAMLAGIDNSTGDIVVTMDGDLQNDPVDIAGMISKMKSGSYDLVAGKRLNRQDNLLRKIPSKIANLIIRKFTGVKISDYGCTLKVFTKEVAVNLGLYGELHRFIPVLAKLNGAKIVEMDVNHHPRIFGKTKYGIGRTFKVFSDLLLMMFFQKYMHKPMHLFGNYGVILFIIGMMINFYLLILKISGESIGDRPLMIAGLLCVIAGIQLVTTGFIAEYLMRTYFESQDKKPYTTKKIVM